MKRVWIAIAVCATLIFALPGCGGKRTPDKYMSKAGLAASEAPVSVTEIKTTATTPQGKPLRAYEVTLSQKPEAKGAGGNKQALGVASIVVVVGDVTVPVEIPNARHAIVGGKKAQLNLVTSSPIVVLIPVANPVTGLRTTLELKVEDAKKKLESGKFDVPLADQILTF